MPRRAAPPSTNRFMTPRAPRSSSNSGKAILPSTRSQARISTPAAFSSRSWRGRAAIPPAPARWTPSEPAGAVRDAACRLHPARRVSAKRFKTGKAAGQFGIIGQRGAAANQDRLVAGAHQMALGPRNRAGDRHLALHPQPDQPVGGNRQLQRHEGRPRLLARQDRPARPIAASCARTTRQRPRCRPARSMAWPFPLTRSSGIDHGGHHARNTGVDQRLRARRRAAVMGAGFERHIGGGAARRSPASAIACGSACGRPPIAVTPRRR